MTFELGYIEDAATVRREIRRRGVLITDKASNYDPPENGVHLCGVTDDGEQPTTVAEYPMPAARAIELFEIAREVAQCGREEGDFIVDLFVNGECATDFYSNRQLWPRAIDAWNSLPSGQIQ